MEDVEEPSPSREIIPVGFVVVMVVVALLFY